LSNKSINEIFINTLKELLAKNNMTRKELAEKLEIRPSTVSMWMNGGSMPRMELLDKIAELFHIPVSYLTTDHLIETAINRELARLDTVTRQYIQLLESNGYVIKLGNEDIRISDQNKTDYTVSRKDFMSMIHYCHIDIENNMKKLLRNYK